MRPQTFVEKTLARAAGVSEVTVGQVVDVRPDVVLSHDNTAAIAQIFAHIGVSRVYDPDRLVVVLDHAAPPPTPRHAEVHAAVREFVRAQGIRHFYDVGRGICHQVLGEEVLVLPGQVVVGADSHTVHLGWLGAFATGLGRSEIAAVWATGEVWLRVPESIAIELTGRLAPGVTTKDLCLRIIGDLGADGANYRSIEFHGDALSALPIDSRMVLTNMMAECGAKNAVIPPDDRTFRWLAERRARRTGQPIDVCEREIRDLAVYPDPDAQYAMRLRYDLGQMEPFVACPHQVDRVCPVSEVAGTRIDLAFIGTCANGRLEDLAMAAEVLRGRRIAAGVRLIVVPASREVLEQAIARGYIATFVAAGAVIGVPGCGPCMGNHMGVPAPGEVVISTANRNYRGRMGTRDAAIYLANPAVVAASALTGVITDPREVMVCNSDCVGAYGSTATT